MERAIRIGKDFNVRWSIRKRVDGERQPYELAGKELVLQYRRPNGTLHEAKEWRVDGNFIIWTFRGRDQKAPGSYGLILTENGGKDGMVTVDTCRAFKLVEHSCEETEGSGSDIVIEDVVLESEVAFAALRGPQGERGPEGPQGPQGERGPQGEQGPAGPSYDDTEIKGKLAELSAEVNELHGAIFGGKKELNLDEKSGKMYLENGTIYDNASSLYADVDLSAYEGKTLVITLSNIYSQSERYTGIAVNGKFVTNFAEKRYTQPVEYVIPANAHLWASHHNTSTMKAEIVINGLVQDDNAEKDAVYVAKNGSDDNEGTEGKPFATIQKAINSRASRIYIGGGVYAETLDLGNYDKKKIEILKKDSFSEVIIEKTPTTLSTSDGTLVDGTTSVYMLPNVSGITADMRYLVQIGIPYGAISQEERRPEQRGRATRLNDTFIRKIRSISSIDGAVAEIERALTEDGRYMYHLDGTTLYYSRPSALSATNPLVRPSAKATLFNNVTSGMTFIMTGIHTRFLEFNIDMSVNSVITDCISEFALGAGAFTYDGSLNMTFRRCEASCCCQGSTGDGFNGHADNVTGYAEGDAEAKCCTCRLEQCWSHDNYDDGFSDHQRCESNVIGGLYEYNGKGGIVPSYGSHCTCYNVESRHNCNGFLSTGTPDATEGGEGTQLTCYNCIASDNTNRYGQNYAGNVAETNAGFAAMNYRCKLIAVQCLAKGNKLGFFTNSEGGGKDGYSELIDCRALNNSQSSWYPKSKPEITIITNSETL